MAVSPTGTRHPAGGPQPVTACLYPSVRLLTLAVDPPSSKRPIVLVALILTAIGLMSVFRPWSSTFAAKSNDIKAVPAPAPAATGGEMAPTVEDPSGEAYVFSLEDLCGYAESEQKAQRFLDDFSAAIEQFEAALNAAKTRLAVSGDPEHLHTAALLEDDPARRIELITRALAADGENAFRVWGAVHMCVGAYAETNCPLQSWQERMLAVDSENREAWLEAAAIRISAGAEGAALHAMQRAASASESRVYWPETVEMIERAFAAVSDMSFRDRVALGVDFAGSTLPNYSAYMNMCREQSPESADWAYACLRYGRLAEQEGRILVGQRMGIGIQQIALSALGDEDQLEAANLRYQGSREKIDAAAIDEFKRSMQVITGNPTLFSRYLAAVKEYGEVQAATIMREEVARWTHRHRDLECIP